MTFGIDLCYIVTPLARQREIAEKLVDHWINGYGATYNPARGKALQKVKLVGSVDEMINHAGQEQAPLIVGTSSRERPDKAITNEEVSLLAEEGQKPLIILFGTGWGLADEIVHRCDKMLVPIKGKGDFNHLSLRVALGIILDRIFGERGGQR